MLDVKRWKQFDLLMVLLAVGLVGYGVVMIHSATCGPDCVVWLPSEEGKRLPTKIELFPPSNWAIRQAVFAVLGVGLMLGLAAVDFRVFRALAYPAYAVSLALLVAVLLLGRGETEYGARRWINLGFFELQPSEIAKVGMILALACWLAVPDDQRLRVRRVLGSVVIAALPTALVFKQPDLGTAGAFVVIWFGMLVAARARPLVLVGIVALALLAVPVGWHVLHDYQRERIETYFKVLQDPESDIFGDGYNIRQARLSIGSGGLGGRGLGLGEQSQFGFLLVKHSDFIFSVLAEEMGFQGAMLLFLLFGLLLMRIARAADRAVEPYGRLLAYGVGCMLLFQIVVNLGSNLTLLPVTGIPLPLVSYGRSALLTNFAALGLVQGVLMRRLKYRY